MSKPRRGSLAYLPRKRAKSPVARIRNWPSFTSGPPKLLAFLSYKAGMAQVHKLDQNPQSPTYGKEVVRAATVLECPPVIVCAIRAYIKTESGLQTLTEAWMENPPLYLARRRSLPKKPSKEAFKTMEESIDRICDIRALLCTQPHLAYIKKKPELIEIKIGGGSIRDKFEYAKSLLGKEVRISEVFTEGQKVDVISVTKGKGFAGPVKRWGIKLISHKARKGRRKPGTLGPRHPARIRYTVPRAGQLGYHQRTEYNKLILMIDSEGNKVTPPGGFPHYGIIRNEFVLIEGSVPGSIKRLVKLRYSIRGAKIESKPKITYITW